MELDLVVVVSESDHGVDGIRSLGLEQHAEDRVEQTGHAGIAGPVPIQDTVADATMRGEIGVTDSGDEAGFWRQCWVPVFCVDVE